MPPLRNFSQIKRKLNHARSRSSISHSQSADVEGTRLEPPGFVDSPQPGQVVFELAADEETTAALSGWAQSGTTLYELDAGQHDWSACAKPVTPVVAMCELEAETPGWHLLQQRERLYGGFYDPNTDTSLDADAASSENISPAPSTVSHRHSTSSLPPQHPLPNYFELAKRTPPPPPPVHFNDMQLTTVLVGEMHPKRSVGASWQDWTEKPQERWHLKFKWTEKIMRTAWLSSSPDSGSRLRRSSVDVVPQTLDRFWTHSAPILHNHRYPVPPGDIQTLPTNLPQYG
jgi:hypothetical protein